MYNIIERLLEFVKQRIIKRCPLRGDNVAEVLAKTKIVLKKVRPVFETLGDDLGLHEPDFR